MDKGTVFISYSRADSEWLEKINLYLMQLKHQHDFEFWDDTKIRPGDEWKKTIDGYIANCRVALLLVSAHFLASDFINNEEVPEILKRARLKGVKIFTLVLEICNFDEYSPLYKYQCLNDPEEPLELLHEIEQKKVLVQIAKEIRIALKPERKKKKVHYLDTSFDDRLVAILILTSLARNEEKLLSMKHFHETFQIENGIEVKRKLLYPILERLESEGMIIKERLLPSKTEKSSTFWKISPLGLSISKEFSNSYLRFFDTTNE